MPFKWDKTKGKYVNSETGRVVAWPRVKKALEQTISFSRSNVQGLSERLIKGQITLRDWQNAMAAEIKQMHIASEIVARGGLANMGPREWGRVGARIRGQYAYLENFASQIELGAQPMDGRLLNRAAMYSYATRGTFENQRRANAVEDGYTQERRVLHAKEHCDACKQLAGMGWQPINSLPAIGEADCRSNCRCTFEYR